MFLDILNESCNKFFKKMIITLIMCFLTFLSIDQTKLGQPISPQEEIAEQRKLKVTTIGGHLADAIKAGHPVNFVRGKSDMTTPFKIHTPVWKILKKKIYNRSSVSFQKHLHSV